MKKITLLFAAVVSSVSMNAQAPKKVLLEDFTGTWCGYCPRGKTIMEDCMTTYPNVIGITDHNGDGLANTFSNAIDAGLAISSYPGGAVDRFLYSGQTTVGMSTSQWKSKCATRLNTVTPVDVQFTSTYNTGTRALSVTVMANFVGTASGDMRINCVLMENGIVTASDPQHNYMGQGCSSPDATSPWYTFPCNITAYVHDGVARVNLSTDQWGLAGVIPASVTSGSNYSTTFTYTVPSAWNASNVYIVAFVSKYGTAASAREVMNTNKGLIGTSTSGATGISENANVNSVEVIQNSPNPFTDHTAIQFQLNTTDNVSVKVYDVYGKEIISLVDSKLVPGEHTFYWFGDNQDGAQVAPGVYYYSISTSSEKVTKPMIFVGQ